MNTQSEKSSGSLISKVIDMLYKLTEFVCMLCLAGQVIIISYGVIARYIFNSSPSWAEEISRILMIWMSMLTISMAVKDDTHVRISFLDKLFKGKGIVVRDIIYSLVNIAFSGVLFWKGFELAQQAARTKLPGSGLPSSVLYASVGVGGLFMVIMLIYKLGERIWQQKQ